MSYFAHLQQEDYSLINTPTSNHTFYTKTRGVQQDYSYCCQGYSAISIDNATIDFKTRLKFHFQISRAADSCERGCRLFLLIDGVAKSADVDVDDAQQDVVKNCKHSEDF